ncbi:MAG: energy transducer TonB [Burkholderiaceae bacterium]|nr:energy transducer TonB [Burkholderiaceae bacterium]
MKPASLPLWRLAAATLAALALHGPARAADEPYELTVWADARFDTDGKLAKLAFLDAEGYPPLFLERLRQRVAAARIQPPQDNGAPATLQTGLGVQVTITPGRDGQPGQVALRGLRIEPLAIKRYAASYPDEVARTGGWKGSVSALCTVGASGQCEQIDVSALPGMPESVRRFARVSMEGWRFIPVHINGKPVASQIQMTFNLNTDDSMPEDFRVPKFDRLSRVR